jgi:hypothetical protein
MKIFFTILIAGFINSLWANQYHCVPTEKNYTKNFTIKRVSKNQFLINHQDKARLGERTKDNYYSLWGSFYSLGQNWERLYVKDAAQPDLEGVGGEEGLEVELWLSPEILQGKRIATIDYQATGFYHNIYETFRCSMKQ